MPKLIHGANLLFKATRVLDAVAEGRAPQRLADIVATTQLPPGTVHRILDALVAERLVRKDAATREYRIGARVLELARNALEDFDVRSAAEPELTRLHASLGDTLSLAVWLDASVVVIDKREGRLPLHTTPAIGERAVLTASALGKAVLAALGPAEQTRLLGSATLPALTPATITDRTTLRGHLEMLANRRYAVEDEEVATGVRAVAAAILDQRGQPLGAIGLSAPATRLSLERCLAVGSELIEAAARISGNLGLNPPERWSRPIVANVEASGVRQVIAASAYVGSSPTWSAKRRRLYWIDLARPVIHCSNPATGDDAVLALPAPAASVVLARDGLLASLQSGVQRVDPDTGRLRPLVDLIAPGGHQRYNSARCDRAGRLWITTMDVTTSRPSGCLYRVDRDGTATRMADQLLLPIGLAWSPDARWFYICDAPRREIYRYAFDVKRGTLSERRVFARVPEGSGRPTGLAVDAEGGIWNTQTDGWCVVRYDPDGGIERVVALPVPKPIDCCFGGTDLRTLFITTGRLGLPERRVAEVPWSGSVLAFDAPHAGVPTTAF